MKGDAHSAPKSGDGTQGTIAIKLSAKLYLSMKLKNLNLKTPMPFVKLKEKLGAQEILTMNDVSGCYPII